MQRKPGTDGDSAERRLCRGKGQLGPDSQGSIFAYDLELLDPDHVDDSSQPEAEGSLDDAVAEDVDSLALEANLDEQVVETLFPPCSVCPDQTFVLLAL